MPHFLSFLSLNCLEQLQSASHSVSFSWSEDGQFDVRVVSASLQKFQNAHLSQKVDVLALMQSAKVVRVDSILTLDQCIGATFGELANQKVDGWACPVCGQSEKGGVREVEFEDSSRYLIIGFKRFTPVYDRVGNCTMAKNNQPIEFSDTLQQNGKSYKLRSVIAHYGRMSRGHYVCESLVDGKWWLFNDGDVTEDPQRRVNIYAQVLLYEQSE